MWSSPSSSSFPAARDLSSSSSRLIRSESRVNHGRRTTKVASRLQRTDRSVGGPSRPASPPAGLPSPGAESPKRRTLSSPTHRLSGVRRGQIGRRRNRTAAYRVSLWRVVASLRLQQGNRIRLGFYRRRRSISTYLCFSLSVSLSLSLQYRWRTCMRKVNGRVQSRVFRLWERRSLTNRRRARGTSPNILPGVLYTTLFTITGREKQKRNSPNI